MTAVPLVLLAALVLTGWSVLADVPARYREHCRRETLLRKGCCPDCEMAWSHCTCVVITFEPWDDDDG